jgi:hypothetical protein
MNLMALAAIIGAALGASISGFVVYNAQEVKVLIAQADKTTAENAMTSANEAAKLRYQELLNEKLTIESNQKTLITTLEKSRENYSKDTANLTKQLASARLFQTRNTNKNCGNGQSGDSSSSEPIAGTGEDQLSARIDEINGRIESFIKLKAQECDNLDEKFHYEWQPWARELNPIKEKTK